MEKSFYNIEKDYCERTIETPRHIDGVVWADCVHHFTLLYVVAWQAVTHCQTTNISI